jgi:hypothetical protein
MVNYYKVYYTILSSVFIGIVVGRMNTGFWYTFFALAVTTTLLAGMYHSLK